MSLAREAAGQEADLCSDLALLVWREVELLDQVVPVPCAWVVQRRLLSMSPWRESASSDGRPAVHGALV
jgi:hypothetical protein